MPFVLTAELKAAYSFLKSWPPLLSLSISSLLKEDTNFKTSGSSAKKFFKLYSPSLAPNVWYFPSTVKQNVLITDDLYLVEKFYPIQIPIEL